MSTVLEESRVETLLAELNERLLKMEQRMGEMEARLPAAAPAAVSAQPAPAPKPQAPRQEEAISEEILMVIAAAVAAFLGKKARIRKVRRVTEFGLNPWSQQGRVSIQASHNVHWNR